MHKLMFSLSNYHIVIVVLFYRKRLTVSVFAGHPLQKYLST